MAVFCEGNNTLTTLYNIFWDLENFGGPHILWQSFVREIVPVTLGNFWMTSSDTLKNFQISGTYKNFEGPHILWRAFVREIMLNTSSWAHPDLSRARRKTAPVFFASQWTLKKRILTFGNWNWLRTLENGMESNDLEYKAPSLSCHIEICHVSLHSCS